LEERIWLYEEVSRLFRGGMRRGQIVREMQRRFGSRLDHHQVVGWTERGVSPYGRVHRFEGNATPELAYVLGVKLGDATQSKGTWQHNYMIMLLVADREFATEFSRCASVVLNCRPFKVWWYRKRRLWCTTVGSIMLYRFLEGGLGRFKEFAEHCTRCVAAFLRGFFDSEASVSDSSLTVSNGHRDVLTYVQHLLNAYFGIETTGPHAQGPSPGTKKLIRRRLATVNLQAYVLRVRTGCVSRFAESVGFTLIRKADALNRLIRKAGQAT
jgi:intein-encoded DNA endonuclease-like protein